jgi:eukaryotic-like serine/threonine-protein kinase
MSILPQANSGTSTASGAKVRLKDRFDIHYDKPLPGFRSPAAAAFVADDTKGGNARHFALICDPKMPPRREAVLKLQKIKSQGVLTPIEVGAVDWAPANRRMFAIVCEQPAGERLVGPTVNLMDPWSEEAIAAYIVAPIIQTLTELERELLPHRGIRPSNIFFRDESRRVAMLGDCMTAPPGLYQSVVYETIEGALSQSHTRGAGSVAQDLYALGVLVLHLLFGKLPGAGMTEDKLIEDKVKRGSFSALVADQRVPTGLNELLRGLLVDETPSRWRVGDVQMWLDGRRMTNKAAPLPTRAQRGFEIGGEECETARHLALMLDNQEPEDAGRILRGQPFENWITRSLGDKKVVEAMNTAFSTRNDAPGAGGQTAQLVSRALMALDPSSPIRFREAATAVDGVGALLAVTMLNGSDLKLPIELLTARLPQFWCLRQSSAKGEDQTMIRFFDKMQRHIEDKRPGYGIERVAYEMMPGLHCLSPFIESRYVDQVQDLLAAIEFAAQAKTIDVSPVDRHIAAFLSVNDHDVDEGHLYQLISAEPATRILGGLQILAFLQESYGPAAVPGLIQLFAHQAKPVIERFKSRYTRTRLQNGLAAILKEGNLRKLADYLDSAEEQRKDVQRFQRARVEFQQTIKQFEKAEKQTEELNSTAQMAGHSVAVKIAGLVSSGIVAVTLFAMGMF